MSNAQYEINLNADYTKDDIITAFSDYLEENDPEHAGNDIIVEFNEPGMAGGNGSGIPSIYYDAENSHVYHLDVSENEDGTINFYIQD
jgi:hypothetical protein